MTAVIWGSTWLEHPRCLVDGVWQLGVHLGLSTRVLPYLVSLLVGGLGFSWPYDSVAGVSIPRGSIGRDPCGDSKASFDLVS